VTSRDFAYWLKGYFEINGTGKGMTPEQAAMVDRHLSLVFKHEIDPSFPADQQAELDAIHEGQPAFTNTIRPDGLVARC
jgi:hypothetical protein